MGIVSRTALAGCGVAIAAGLWYAGRGTPAEPPGEAAARADAQQLASTLRERAAALHARAITLSALPRLATAVATDAATVRDLTDDELGFQPLAGETIELAQRTRARVTSLRRFPASSSLAIDLARRGLALAIERDAIVISETLDIAPVVRSDAVGIGELAVAWRVPRAALPARGTLVVASGALALGAPLPAAGGRVARIALPGLPDDAALVAPLGAAAVPSDRTLRAAGLALGLAALATALLAGRGRRRRDGAKPARFGRYETLGMIAATRASRSYVARATCAAGFERRVTLDVVRTPRPEQLAQARSAARISHPNLVEILDLGRAGDACFIASEYVDGIDLARVLAHLRTIGRAIPPAIAVAIARRLCDGLAAAHAAGAVHGDVRLGHVLVSQAGTIKLGGWGLSAAPSDPRCDVAALRSLLWELLGTPAARGTGQQLATCEALDGELARMADAFGAAPTDRDIATWLATDAGGRSPTLRGPGIPVTAR